MKYENMKIGEEQKKLEAEKVSVLSTTSEEVKDKDGADVGTKLVMTVKHSAGELQISKVKYEKNGAITESGLWLREDKEGNLPYASAVAHMLRHYKVDTVENLKGREVDTTQDANGFLIVKAY